MVTKPTGRPRGRPAIPLASDPNRYAYAAYRLWVQLAAERKIGERDVAKAVATMALSDPYPERSNIEAMFRGDPFRVVVANPRFSRRDQREGRPLGFRHSDDFAPHADDLRRLARHFERRSRAHAAWLQKMTRILRICESGDRSKIEEAARLADEIGEVEHWRECVFPAYFSADSAPEFIPHTRLQKGA